MLLSMPSQYAITGLMRLSVLPADRFCRVDELVDGTSAPRHAVAKVFYELAKRRILESARGMGGGYRPALGIGDLTLMDIIEAVDGPYDPSALTGRGLCDHDPACPLAILLQPVSDRLEEILRTTRIRDLVAAYSNRPCCPAQPNGTTHKPCAISPQGRGGSS
jgi:Rrf2 family iron-sulfur cluster assembly transcriptional regulator